MDRGNAWFAALLTGLVLVVGWWLAFRFEFTESISSPVASPALLPLPSNPEIGGRCAPNLDVTGPPAFRVNSRGYRGPDVVVPKPASTFRVAIAGGPFTFGRDTLDEKDLVGSQLQKILLHNVNNRTIEVVTVGPGSGIDSVKGGILEMDLAIDIEPDLVVWVVERRNVDPLIMSGPWAWLPERRRGLLSTSSESLKGSFSNLDSQALKLAMPIEKAGTAGWARAREAFASGNDNWSVSGGDSWPEVARPELTDSVARVAALCQDRKIAFLAVPLPHALECDSELRALAIEASKAAWGAPPLFEGGLTATARLVADLRARKIPALDLTPIFRAAADLNRQLLVNYNARTWTAEAAELVASQVAAHVLTSGAIR